MKKQIILGSFLALVTIGHSQIYTPSGVIQGSSGALNNNVGIGATSPFSKLHVQSTSANDGIIIQQNNTTAGGHATLKFFNSYASSTSNYGFCASGAGSAEGPGHFMLYDYTNNLYNLFISGGGTGYPRAGNIGIGTTSPDYSKLDVTTTYNNIISPNTARYSGQFITNASVNETFGGLHGSVYNSNTTSSSLSQNYGVYGDATTVLGPDNRTYGVYGSGANGNANWGGYFEASGGGVQNIGVYGSASGATFNNYAGLFSGDLVVNGGNAYINGLAFCTLSAWSSDQKLKKDIKALTNTTEKIKMLKPSTYLFKTDEFATMNLPVEKQMGLIAQDLEKVFPELVMDLKEQSFQDKNGKKTIIPEHKTVNYIGLIPVLIAGMQEQQTQIETQQKQLDSQKQLIDQLFASKSAMPTGINEVKGADGFQIDQNIPNPFSTETTIKYNLGNQTKTASLVVYDLSGKQITSFPLDNSSSSITITSEKLQAGIYIYSVIADGKIMDSKRMVVANKQ